MRRFKTPVFLSLLALCLVNPGTATAQTPDASPSASPVSGSSEWTVTDSREIAVEGEPVAISPDGTWLAGVGSEKNQVCAWEIETLTPTCADVGGPVDLFIGGMRLEWAPDSSAFTFASGSMRTLEYGEIFVFEPNTGALTQLTESAGNEPVPLYLGAAWTSDSQQVVFTMTYGFGSDHPRPEIGRIDRTGGEVEVLSLPGDWTDDYIVHTPPFVGGDGSIYLAVDSDENIGGIWNLTDDGTGAEQMVQANGDPPVDLPMITSNSPDGRYLNVVSMSGLARMEPENTFYFLDTETGDLAPLDSEGNMQLIAFAPDNETGLMVRKVDGRDLLHTIDLASGTITPIAGSPEAGIWLKHIPVWSDANTVFLPASDGGTLVTLEPAG